MSRKLWVRNMYAGPGGGAYTGPGGGSYTGPGGGLYSGPGGTLYRSRRWHVYRPGFTTLYGCDGALASPCSIFFNKRVWTMKPGHC
jgi:hypothetical protein